MGEVQRCPRYEDYTGHKDFSSFSKDQASAFKKHLAKQRSHRSGDAMAGSTVLATTSALKEFFRWLSSQPGYRGRIVASDAESLNLSENERCAFREPKLKTFPTLEQVRAAIGAMPAGTEIEMRDRQSTPSSHLRPEKRRRLV